MVRIREIGVLQTSLYRVTSHFSTWLHKDALRFHLLGFWVVDVKDGFNDFVFVRKLIAFAKVSYKILNCIDHMTVWRGGFISLQKGIN